MLGREQEPYLARSEVRLYLSAAQGGPDSTEIMMSGFRPLGRIAWVIVCGTEAERAGADALFGRSEPQRAFTCHHIDPLVGIVVRVVDPRLAKLVQCRRPGRRAAQRRVLRGSRPTKFFSRNRGTA